MPSTEAAATTSAAELTTTSTPQSTVSHDEGDHTTLPAVTGTETEDHDHDHEPTGTISCEAHGDHWDCPSGVPEPTTPPAVTTTGTAEESVVSATPSEFNGAAVHLRTGGLQIGVIGALAALIV